MTARLSESQFVEGSLSAAKLRFAVVVSRFNSFITERLLDGALDGLLRSGAQPNDIMVYRTPGAFELPHVAAKILAKTNFDAVIVLGCLMRGDTIHFDLIAGEVTRGLSKVSHESGVPVTFGVLTTDTLDQAVHRAGAKAGNKGAEAAMAAIEQANLYRQIENQNLSSTP